MLTNYIHFWSSQQVHERQDTKEVDVLTKGIFDNEFIAFDVIF